jgi:hypothetical protein
MLLGTLNQCMISLMISTALAAVVEVVDFTSIHFVQKGQVIVMVWS